MSGGGPYALATLSYLPQRVKAAIVNCAAGSWGAAWYRHFYLGIQVIFDLRQGPSAVLALIYKRNYSASSISTSVKPVCNYMHCLFPSVPFIMCKFRTEVFARNKLSKAERGELSLSPLQNVALQVLAGASKWRSFQKAFKWVATTPAISHQVYELLKPRYDNVLDTMTENDSRCLRRPCASHVNSNWEPWLCCNLTKWS